MWVQALFASAPPVEIRLEPPIQADGAGPSLPDAA